MTEEAVVAADVAVEEAVVAPVVESERPAWLPEKFKEPEALAKSYVELEKVLLEKGKIAPESYEVNLEGISINTEDDLFSGFAALAKEAKFSNEQFNNVLKFAAESGMLDMPNMEAEIEKLGPQGQEILGELTQFAERNLSVEEQEVLKDMAYTAEQVNLLNKLVKRATVGDIPAKAGDVVNNNSKDSMQDELNGLLNDPAIRSDNDKKQKAVKLAEAIAKLG